MQTYFSSFTPEWAHAFVQDLAAGFQQRREFLDKTRQHTHALLADFRKAHREVAERAANDRQVFLSELRSGVHTLRSRFQLDLRQMASELHAASEAFRSRPGYRVASFFRRPAQPETAAEGQQGFEARAGTGSRSAHGEKPGKKRRG